nr:hypothetical protein [Nanoarchaeum sp.]
MTDDLKDMSLGDLIRGMNEIIARHIPIIVSWEEHCEDHGNHPADVEILKEARQNYANEVRPYVHELNKLDWEYLRKLR